MDGWMDGWRRPNHMRSQIGGPKAMRPVGFRRLAGELHSVAKQALLRIAFRVDFGGQNPPNIHEILSIRALIFADVFRGSKLLLFEAPRT